jgi:dihydrofolate synthase/folylpolyglutamate synthase
MTEIDLSLDRVKLIAQRLGVLTPTCTVIMVAGTNGKGSTVTTLETIYHLAGYNTATFTSPFLFKPNEQVRINQKMVTDQALCEAFTQVENERGDVSLTSFEFFTLAAFVIFKSQEIDVMIVEIGLGGRLDAVNILHADLAIVTSIDIDHTAWLGPTREHIGFEKAGIFKPNQMAVCGDRNPPQRLLARAKELAISLDIQGQTFGYQEQHQTWSWWSRVKNYERLPVNQLNIENMSTVLMAVSLLQNRLSVSENIIVKGLQTVQIPARVQIIAGDIIKIYDVSHNPHAIAYLQKRLISYKQNNQVHAVFSMLADKDIVASINTIKESIDDWYVAALSSKRAATLSLLDSAFKQANVSHVNYLPTIQIAYQQAIENAQQGDVVVVFGSFHTVAEVHDFSNKNSG